MRSSDERPLPRALVSLVLGWSALGVACTSAETAEPTDPPIVDLVAEIEAAEDLSERPCPEDSVLTYDDFGGPFVLSWCTGCHASGLPEGERQGAPAFSNFDTLEDIRAAAARMWARSGDHNLTMPPAGGPDALDREMFGEWLACGAPSDDDP